MVSVAYVDGLWIVGELYATVHEDVATSYFDEPRLYVFNGKNHGIMNMPGEPKKIDISKASLIYAANGEIGDLYLKQVMKSVIVTPANKIEVFK